MAVDTDFVAEYHSDSVPFFMSYDGHVVTPGVTTVDVSLGAQGQNFSHYCEYSFLAIHSLLRNLIRGVH